MSTSDKKQLIDPAYLGVAINPADAELEIRVGADGIVWMGFFAKDGKSALLNLNAIAEKNTGVISGALAAWCADRQKQAAEIRA